jgi:hypothetical protein
MYKLAVNILGRIKKLRISLEEEEKFSTPSLVQNNNQKLFFDSLILLYNQKTFPRFLIFRIKLNYLLKKH